jgi:hypothetical protein
MIGEFTYRIHNGNNGGYGHSFPDVTCTCMKIIVKMVESAGSACDGPRWRKLLFERGDRFGKFRRHSSGTLNLESIN